MNDTKMADHSRHETKTKTLLLTLLALLTLTATTLTYQIHTLKEENQTLTQKLTTLEEKIKQHYTGNPFTTALYPGQFQAENITGMHWYTYLSGQLLNRTDVIAYPEQTATFIIFGKDTDGDGVYDIVYAKNATGGQIQYGGEWDAGGVDGANASAVIQAAINALKKSYGSRYKLTGKIFFRAGEYELKTPLNLANIYNVHFEGEGSGNDVGQTQFLVATNSIGLDLTGARFCTFKNIVFKTQEGYTPKALILLARDETGASAGEHAFYRCVFYGDAEYGLVYNYGSEIDMFRDCLFFSKRRAVVLTSSNILGITSPYVTIASGSQSMLQNFFDGCVFYRPESTSPTGETILLDGGGHHVFTKCFAGGGTLYFFKIDFTNVNSVFGVMVRESNFETRFLTVDAQTETKWIVAWRIENCYFADTDGITIDCNKENVLFHYGIIKGCKNLWNNNCEFQFWRVYRSIIDVGESYYPIALTINVLDSSRVRGWKDYTTITSQVTRPLNKIEYVDAIVENSGTATVANGEYITHGLASSLNIGASNSTVLITPYTTTYDGVPVVVGCDFVNATHFRVSVYWVNGTAISDDAIQIWWQVKYTS